MQRVKTLPPLDKEVLETLPRDVTMKLFWSFCGLMAKMQMKFDGLGLWAAMLSSFWFHRFYY